MIKTMLSFLITLSICQAFSQSPDPSIVSVQGGMAQEKSMSLSWTIGDLVTGSAVAGNTLFTQGFQQPTLTVQEVEPSELPASGSTFEATVFPNPFSEEINVKVDHVHQPYMLEIYDPSGSLVYRKRCTAPLEKIGTQHWPVAQYLLRIADEATGTSSVFRIIKAY